MEPTVGIWREVVDRLTPVAQLARQALLDVPQTRETHAGAHANIAALRQI
jgi:hypothetical protein